ncbi:PHB depolymerase family esterase [Paracoccus sp. S1E-3]|uniref:extracellular catalytic domain type 1 short-chain-length polyhydroxyalkanoate depolymerase n=1 Tax=Paracoccus sp. S1E-3 TaxID=2756130 RepID=UPI0015EE82F3|nr:PHB depolymerase family esterase [Paracoccus sp. S1E-3]MBA4491929.1 PHB depolymerase family esterase [Paracoccus sp. S1E-3]
MTTDFATAMRRALGKARAADPAAATSIIQQALAGRAEPAQTTPQAENAPKTPAANPFVSLLRDGCTPCAGGGLMSGLKLPPAALGKQITVPDGASYTSREHSGPAGSRSYTLYIPSERPEGLRGVILMLHGCTQSPDDFARGTRMNDAAEKAGYIVAYPEQSRAHNLQSCWNWFRPEDQSRGRGEPEILAGIARELLAEFNLPQGRAFVAGLSAGGAMAAIMAEAYPDLFAAAGVHSGLPAGAASDVVSAFAAMRGDAGARSRPRTTPMIVFHGMADATVAPVNGDRLIGGSGIETRHEGNGRSWSRLIDSDGSELWRVERAGHAWFGGDPAGSYTDPLGPDASAEMLRFFTQIAEDGVSTS